MKIIDEIDKIRSIFRGTSFVNLTLSFFFLSQLSTLTHQALIELSLSSGIYPHPLPPPLHSIYNQEVGYFIEVMMTW